MKRKEMIRIFQRTAESAGKPFRAETMRHGKVRIVCGGQTVILPNRSGEIKDYQLFRHRLGLHATLSRT